MTQSLVHSMLTSLWMSPHGLGVYLGLIRFGHEVLGHMGPNVGLSIKGYAGQCPSEKTGRHTKGNPGQHYSCYGEDLSFSLSISSKGRWSPGQVDSEAGNC